MVKHKGWFKKKRKSGLDRSIAFTFPADDVTIETIRAGNESCNLCLRIGFKKRTWNKVKIHRATYRKVRKLFPKLNSSLVCTARDQASDMLKREKCRTLPVKRPFSSIRYNERNFSFEADTKVLSYSTLGGRKKVVVKIPEYFVPYLKGRFKAMTLSIINGKVVGHLMAELPAVKRREVKSVLGIDRGILFPAVTSNNNFFDSKHIRKIKGKYQHLRSQLQAKGTPSAKRHLKKMSGKEQRFVRDTNNCLAKKIANMPFTAFALEKLSVKRKKRNGKKFNGMLGRWAFRQFQDLLEMKCEMLGKTVVYVNPRYTSQTCSNCGRRNKNNRKGRRYVCDKCGFELHSDLNASRNIAELGKSKFGRLTVKQPIVASLKSSATSPLTC